MLTHQQDQKDGNWVEEKCDQNLDRARHVPTYGGRKNAYHLA